jgi:hypothetical protein
MKKILTALIAMTSLSAFSQVVYLDSGVVDLQGNSATLVKTAATPTTVDLKLTVPTTLERCNPMDFIRVTDGVRCGFDSVPRFCGGYGHPHGPVVVGPRVVVTPGRPGPRPGSVPAGRRVRVGVGVGVGYPGTYGPNYCGYDQVPRTCNICVRPYYETVDMAKSFKLQFEKFNQEATIEFALDQNYNLVLDVKGVSPSCVKTVIYGKNGTKTGAKITMKRGCR